jgi:hypothetical protein
VNLAAPDIVERAEKIDFTHIRRELISLWLNKENNKLLE